MNLYTFLEDKLPRDHCRQSRAIDAALAYLQGRAEPTVILDLGCGVGATKSVFERLGSHIRWVGVDIESSPEVDARVAAGESFVTYDGETLPFADGSFDVVFSNQVMEHVRFPEKVLSEVRRVLRPGGRFIGQTSQLEMLSLSVV